MQRYVLLFLACLLLMPVSMAQETERDLRDSLLLDDVYYTYHHPSGNRFVEGTGTFPNVTVQDFALNDVPLWIVAVPLTAGESFVDVAWTVALRSGQLQSGLSSGEALGTLDTAPTSAATPLRPTLNPEIGVTQYIPAADESPFSSPVPLANDGRLYVASNGDLIYAVRSEELSRLALNLQPDAQITVSATDQIAVYAEATDQRYVHGIMGDNLEGAALVVLQLTDNLLEIVARVDLPGEAIYEGLAPMWADVNQDGIEDLITTISDSRNGSRIRVYLFDGEQITGSVDGPAIGTGFRWQHQLAWGAFGPNGEMELVEVRTPHIGGIVRFYQFTGDAMQIVAELPGYTSHLIGSRNLDMAVAGDYNGDGQPEIVLPSQDRTRIAGIQHTVEGAQVVWELPLEGRLSTNLSAVNTPNGLALGAGTEDGRLRVWSSPES